MRAPNSRRNNVSVPSLFLRVLFATVLRGSAMAPTAAFNVQLKFSGRARAETTSASDLNRPCASERNEIAYMKLRTVLSKL